MMGFRHPMMTYKSAGGGAPFHLGNDTIASLDTFPASEDRAICGRFTLAVAASVSAMYAYFVTGTGVAVKFFIAANSGGTPGAILAVSSPVTVSAAGAWATAAISTSLSAADYFLGVFSSDSGVEHGITASGAGDMEMANGFSYATPPGTWPGSDATYTNIPCIYAVCTPT